MDSAVRELLKETRELELVARRNVSSVFSGNYLTTIPGSGLEFHEARRYVPGESVQRIDWKMTARHDVPYVRTFLEERQRDIFIALDVSPSMATGWGERTKLELAVEMAATLAVSAASVGDRFGWVTFSDRVFDVSRPRAGKKQLFRALKTLVSTQRDEPEPCDLSDPRCAVHAIQRFRGGRFVIFLISDFIDHDVPDDLRYFNKRHDISLIHVYDPLEYAAASVLRLPAFSPEGAPRWTSMRPEANDSLQEMNDFLERQCQRYGMTFASVTTREQAAGALTELFRHKRRRLAK